MKVMTLCLLLRDNSLLLGMKKCGFGAGRYNGFGGKVEHNEDIETCARREVKEEAGIKVHSLGKVAELSFHFFHKPELDCIVHTFLVSDWSGELVESNEMKPEWFSIDKLPFTQMWPDDIYWPPHVLAGKFVSGKFTFGEEDVVLEHKLDVKSLPKQS